MSARPDLDRTDRPWTAQPAPQPSTGRPVHDTLAERLIDAGYHDLAADLRDRGDYGQRKYGTPLQPHNGRRWDRDLYEELLDALAYGEQGFQETEDLAVRSDLIQIIDAAERIRVRAVTP